MRSFALATACVAAVASAACLPTDDASLPLGSVAFRIGADERTRDGVGRGVVADGWTLAFQRVVLSFKQMTIGKRNDESDACSYRGRGARQNVVFDVREEIEQSFNGITPTDCPDVGVVLGPPDDATTLGQGITIEDVKRLLVPTPAIAFIEASATKGTERYDLQLRFESARTTTRWGGCTDVRKGVLVLPNARETVRVPITVLPLFSAGRGSGSPIYFAPFALADQLVHPDHVVTMEELDALPVVALGPNASIYKTVLAERALTTMGDYVREVFRDIFDFGTYGKCNGLDPGSTE